MSKSFEQCIHIIMENIEQRKAVDYGDKKSVRRYNASMNAIIHNLEYIDIHFPEQFSKVIMLLEHPDQNVVRHCVPTIFRLKHTSIEQKQRIIDISKAWLADPQIDQVSKLYIADNVARWESVLTNLSQSCTDSL